MLTIAKYVRVRFSSSELLGNKEQELSRITRREDKRHYKEAYRAQPIFRIEGVQKGTDSGSPLRNQTLWLKFGGSRVQMRLPTISVWRGPVLGPLLCNQTMGLKSAPMPLLVTNTKVLKDNH